ncbi:MAG TPA: polymer-forming cytoskeletal protein [Rectinemataceae bacterium]
MARIRFKHPLLYSTELGESTRMEGELKTASSLLVKGFFSGSIQTKAHVGVDRTANIQACLIEAESVLVKGRFSGSIRARSIVEVVSGASVSASIAAPQISIEPEAGFEGELRSGPDVHE